MASHSSTSTPHHHQDLLQDLPKHNTITTTAATIDKATPTNPTTTEDSNNTTTNHPPPKTLETSEDSSSSTDNNNNNENNGGGGGVIVCVGRSNRSVTWGSCVAQGRRKYMEDFVAVVPGFLSLKCHQVGGCRAPHCKHAAEDSPLHYFGLFDGHGGSQVSHYCSERLHELLVEEWNKEGDEDTWSRKWEVALTRAFNRADDAFEDRVLAPSLVGSTAVVVILSSCQIIVANCGDSRAVLCRGSQVIPLTVDHKLDRDDEVERITTAGARILYLGCPRVEGILNMTRAIGDHELKKWIISDPEVTFTSRTEEDECLILASDGLWDVKSNEEVMMFARRALRERRRQVTMGTNGSLTPTESVAEEVVKAALYTSCDNISVIVVDLKRPRRRPQQIQAVDA